MANHIPVAPPYENNCLAGKCNDSNVRLFFMAISATNAGSMYLCWPLNPSQVVPSQTGPRYLESRQFAYLVGKRLTAIIDAMTAFNILAAVGGRITQLLRVVFYFDHSLARRAISLIIKSVDHCQSMNALLLCLCSVKSPACHF